MKKLNSTILVISLLISNIVAEPSLPYDIKQLIHKRELAIKKIDFKYLVELENLKVKYTKSGNLEVANLINRIIIDLKPDSGNLTAQTVYHEIVGKWEFEYKGKKRSFEFMSNSKFTGQYLVDGKRFSGKWRVNGKKIGLSDENAKLRIPHYLKIVSSDTLIFVGTNGSMVGVKK